ncbi:MAG: hypothetical protein M1148_01095 [Candidatus Thermoplasmatota archaeon]|nr:hypothetical protein [Candidatus Thermoplasmatota archaeon]MCL5437779.1 hypothetical protein [Candidatus Thermoplasmatota archaeon]
MNLQEVLRNIVVQGTMLEVDTSFYQGIMSDEERLSSDDADLVSRIFSRIVRMCEVGKMDPWNVDIASFAEVLRGMLDERFRDFAQAGYVMLSAWHLLFRKSQMVLERARIVEEEAPDQFMEIGEVEIPDLGLPYFDLEPVSVAKPLELKPPVRHSETRRIMVLDILMAIRNAAEVQRTAFKSEKEEVLITPAQIENILGELHAEEPEKEIEELLNRILAINVPQFYMEEIWGEGIEQKTFLVYSMFLARGKKILLEQDYDFGPILVRVKPVNGI